MSRSTALVITLCLLSLAPTAIAANGARTVEYSQSDIVPIRAKIRFSTLIVLPASEDILDFTTGDKEFWIINGAHNLCYVHPAQTSIRSNLNLITASGHVYSFALSEISNQPNQEPDLKVFVVSKDNEGIAGLGGPVQYVRASEAEAYKQEAEAARAQAAQLVHETEVHAQQELSQYRLQYPAQLKFDYRYSSKAGRPPFSVSAIYHDDKFTYIKCSAQEKPTIYEVKDGKPSLVNFDFERGVYIVPKIIDKGYLAIGKQKLSFERRG
jgi:type IV secretory pathway VirB9-like protein